MQLNSVSSRVLVVPRWPGNWGSDPICLRAGSVSTKPLVAVLSVAPEVPRDEEVARLKRELARVKKERDFLREAATFFAKEWS